MYRLSTLALAPVVVAGLLGAAQPAAAASSPAPSQLKPRVVDLRPRITDLKPRVVDLRPRRRRNTFTVDSDVLFAFDSARLSAEAAGLLAGVVRDLRAAHPKRIVIVGYTDSIGSDGYNQVLSERRAKAVTAYLRKHVGAAGVRYAAAGRGESHPVAANTKPDGSDNPDGRRQNRRVTVTYTN